MAMETPLHCIPLSVKKRELTENTFHSAQVAGLTLWVHLETRRMALRSASCVF